MKKIHLAFILCISLIFISCKQEVKIQKEDIQHAEIKIEGMTCEVGCAKLIETNVGKIDGVKMSDVSFEDGIGQFSFDNNITSIDNIEKTINGIAGGKLYKVTDIKIVENLNSLIELEK